MKMSFCLIDEPSKGLAPIVVEKVMESIHTDERKNNDCFGGTKFFMASTIGDVFTLLMMEEHF